MSLITNIERIANWQIAVKEAIRGELSKVWTAMPAISQQQSDGHTGQFQAAINGIQTLIDGTIKNLGLPQSLDAPIHFAGGGGVTHTHPVAKDDEGILLFMARAQDTWHQSGGTNNNPIDQRMFDLSDARYIPGGRSNPRKMKPAPSTSSSQVRSDDGNHVSDVHPKNGITHASTSKVATSAGSGSSQSQTFHTPTSIRHSSGAIFMNC